MIIGDHYVGENIHFSLQDKEYWKKTLGPIFIYLNSNSTQSQTGNVHDLLWQDAKTQVGASVISIIIIIYSENQPKCSCMHAY